MSDSTDINQLPTPEQPHASGQGGLPPMNTYNPHQPELQNGPLQATQPHPPPQQQQQQPQSTQYSPHVGPPPQHTQQPQPQPQYSQGPPQGNQQVPPSEPLSQEIIQQLIDGVQRASSTGATKLQSRDIPQDTSTMTMDQQQQPNYVPGNGPNEPSSQFNRDYIQEQETMETMLAEKKRREAKTDRLNEIYEEVQTPILVVVLFFVFQLPFIRKTFQSYMPNLWVEGNPTLGAYLIQATAFGTAYYSIRQLIQWLSVM